MYWYKKKVLKNHIYWPVSQFTYMFVSSMVVFFQIILEEFAIDPLRSLYRFFSPIYVAISELLSIYDSRNKVLLKKQIHSLKDINGMEML